jgi:capsular polysaccharide biosynthesis protein
MEDAMDEQKLLNIAVAEQPTLSYGAVKPKRTLTALLGGFTAIFAGLCAAYFAESSRSTVSTPRELEAVSKYPVLGTFPLAPELKGQFGAEAEAARRKRSRVRLPGSLSPSLNYEETQA